MHRKGRRALTVATAVVGALALGLGVALALTGFASGFGPGAMARGYADGRGGVPGWALPAPGDQDAARGRDDRQGFGDRPWREGIPTPMVRGPMRAMGPGAHAAGLALFLAFGAAAAFGVVALVRLAARGRSRGAEDAESILRREFAEGRLPEDEYRSRLETLRKSR